MDKFAKLGWILVGTIGVVLLVALVDRRSPAEIAQIRAQKVADSARMHVAARDETFKQQAESWLLLSLKDPDAAKLKGSHVMHTAGVSALCGFVNAKNGFGAYSGEQGFIVLSRDEIMTEHALSRELLALRWAKYC